MTSVTTSCVTWNRLIWIVASLLWEIGHSLTPFCSIELSMTTLQTHHKVGGFFYSEIKFLTLSPLHTTLVWSKTKNKRVHCSNSDERVNEIEIHIFVYWLVLRYSGLITYVCFFLYHEYTQWPYLLTFWKSFEGDLPLSNSKKREILRRLF